MVTLGTWRLALLVCLCVPLDFSALLCTFYQQLSYTLFTSHLLVYRQTLHCILGIVRTCMCRSINNNIILGLDSKIQDLTKSLEKVDLV
jgi:hypothetical protein